MTQKSFESDNGKPSTVAATAKADVTTERSVADEVASQAEAAKTAATRAAQDTVAAARDRAEEHAETARAGVAQSVDSTATDIREAGRAFDPNSIASNAANRLADNLSEAANAVRTADLSSIQSDLTEFARRNPLAFFGGAAVLGFMAGRLLKASQRAEPTMPDPSVHGDMPAHGTDRSHWGYS